MRGWVFEELHEAAEGFCVSLAAWLVVTLPFVFTGVRAGCGMENGTNPTTFELGTTAFQSGADIPEKFTCSGPDVSPPLSWTDPPAGTQSFVLIADDPDAPGGTWVHWVAYDLPASLRQLPEGVPKDGELKRGGRQGLNDFPSLGYRGPCPPPGKPHRYYFRLYAVDRKLGLKAGASRNEVERAMKGHVLGQAELMGRHRR
jgi:Raf kinase inhibitor-like YbhB/YbcL family protein